jgi:hypothetical protein
MDKSILLKIGKEGSEVVTKCRRLKLLASDGKFRETDYSSIKPNL